MRGFKLHPIPVVVLLAVIACGTGAPIDTGSAGAAATTTSSSSVTTTEPRAATVPPATTTTPTTVPTAEQPNPTLVLLDRAVARPQLLFVDLDGDIVLTVPLDRRTPDASHVVDDRQGGIVVNSSPPPSPAGGIVWYPAGADTWQLVGGAGATEQLAWAPPSVVGPDLLYGVSSYDDYHDAITGGDVLEQHFELLLQPLAGGEAEALLSAEATTSAHQSEYRHSGSIPVDFSMGGGMLALLWTDESCPWLEFREGGQAVEMAANPFPAGTPCDEASPAQARLSRDGRYLVMVLHPPGWVAVYDLVEGGEVGRVDGPLDHVYFDGERTIAAAQLSADYSLEGWIVAGIEAKGLAVITLEAAPGTDLIGVLPHPPELPAGATLVSVGGPTTCSGSGAPPLVAQPDLPEAVAATRAAIAQAGGSCDVFALADLAGDVQWQREFGDCGDPPLVSTAEADLVPLWYQTERDSQSAASLSEALNTAPALEDGFYWWRGEHHDVGIATDGTWVRYAWKPTIEPCETIWCTC